MKIPEVVNTVDISGNEYVFNTLPDEKKKEIGIMIQDSIMGSAGYKRKSA